MPVALVFLTIAACAAPSRTYQAERDCQSSAVRFGGTAKIGYGSDGPVTDFDPNINVALSPNRCVDA